MDVERIGGVQTSLLQWHSQGGRPPPNGPQDRPHEV